MKLLSHQFNAHETRCNETCIKTTYERYSVQSGYLEGLRKNKNFSSNIVELLTL